MKNLNTILIGALLITSCSITKNVPTVSVEPVSVSVTDTTNVTVLSSLSDTTKLYDEPSITDSVNISVSVILPGDKYVPENYDSDTSLYNVYEVTYEKEELSNLVILPVSYGTPQEFFSEKLSKVVVLQSKVLRKDVEY